MSAALAPSWPASRVLLGWWRELADLQPQHLWCSHLLFHRVEALVRVTHARSLDLWQRALLRLVHTRVPAGAEPESSFADLQIDRQVLAQFVRELTDAGLLHSNGEAAWRLTDIGRHALETGSLAVRTEERRVFCFVDNSAVQQPMHFLPLRQTPLLPLRQSPRFVASGPTPDRAEWIFDVACLETCIRQTPEWKARYLFPSDVETLLPPRPEELPGANWQRVILDTLEQLTLVVIRTTGSAGAPVLLGFPVRTEGWVLEREPVLVLTEGWEKVLPDLAEEPSLETWRQAWQNWCQPRSLPRPEVEACWMERSNYRLLVHAPHRLIDRLRTARSDAIKQESWLLAGSGRTRTAALLLLEPL